MEIFHRETERPLHQAMNHHFVVMRIDFRDPRMVDLVVQARGCDDAKQILERCFAVAGCLCLSLAKSERPLARTASGHRRAAAARPVPWGTRRQRRAWHRELRLRLLGTLVSQVDFASFSLLLAIKYRRYSMNDGDPLFCKPLWHYTLRITRAPWGNSDKHLRFKS